MVMESRNGVIAEWWNGKRRNGGMADGMAEWAEWQNGHMVIDGQNGGMVMEWRNGGMAEWWNCGRNGGMVMEWRNCGMAEWRNRGVVEWRTEWRYGREV